MKIRINAKQLTKVLLKKSTKFRNDVLIPPQKKLNEWRYSFWDFQMQRHKLVNERIFNENLKLDKFGSPDFEIQLNLFDFSFLSSIHVLIFFFLFFTYFTATSFVTS